MMSHRTIVTSAGSVESEDGKILDIVMIVVCVSIRCYLMIITVRRGSTCPIVLFVKKICLVPVMRHMKCPVDMQYTGIVSRS